MSARALLVLGLGLGFLSGCTATSETSSFGGDDFAEASTGDATGGVMTTQAAPTDESSTGTPDASETDASQSTGLDTDTEGGESTGEEPGFEKGPGLYVSALTGADSNEGSREAPMRSIQWALQEAQAQGLPAVYVSEGLYTATHDDLTTIELVPGISVYGGFSSSSWDRDPAAYPTQIIDESLATTGSDAAPHHAVHAPVGVLEDVVLDGFIITAAQVGYAAAIFVEGGSPTFSNNSLLGRPAATVSMAVRIIGGRPVFTDNLIDPGGATSSSFGVDCDTAQPRFVRNNIHSGDTGSALAVRYELCDGSLANNVIRAERPTSTSGSPRGLELSNSSPDVLSNSIATEPAPGYTGYHAFLSGTSAPRIDNNNFVRVDDLEEVYCVYASGGAAPSSLRNNNLGCSQLYYGTISATTLLELESNLPGAADNIVVEAAVMDAVAGDLRLRDDGTVPCTLARGGMDLSDVVVDGLSDGLASDRAGTLRSAPWSIGAFELDGDCQ